MSPLVSHVQSVIRRQLSLVASSLCLMLSFLSPEFLSADSARVQLPTTMTEKTNGVVNGPRMHAASATINAIKPPFPRVVRRILPALAIFVLFVIYLTTATGSDNSVDVSYRLSKQSGRFPRKIWQTWKVGPLEFEERDLPVARSWAANNPGYRYEVLTDENDLHYVETHFGPQGYNRPDIVRAYRELTARIIKADLLRYLIMYVEGGVYADIDVEALKGLDKFTPDRFEERDIDMIIGVEVDQPQFSDHPILGQKSRSFCQWTFVCKPRLPVMMNLVNHILGWLNEMARKQGVPISQVNLDFDDVITGTGPSAFTDAILKEMSVRAGRKVTWDTFHNMAESKLVGGFLVLTVEAFAAGQGHSDSGNHNGRAALIRHHYHASGWPNAHPRFRHPIHGEVERCNWDAQCVHDWDESTAAFDALSNEDKAKKIAMKQISDNIKVQEKPAT